MKLTKMKFDEEKMTEECGELIESNNLTTCKPEGVGLFSYSDGPPAAGGGRNVSMVQRLARNVSVPG